jgi:2-dehydropantoate 2-reductase
MKQVVQNQVLKLSGDDLKICILGAGALGCAIGGVLTESGNEVWLVNRSAGLVDTLSRVGLTMRENGVDRVVPVHAATHCSGVSPASGPVDLVVVLVKSFHTREAIESARAILGDNTVVLSLQNGIGHEDVLVDVVGRARVMAGKTYAGGVMLAPGHVIVGTKNKETIIGELDGELTGDVSPRARRIADTFQRAGLATTVSGDIMGTIWEKLLVNVATGALSGITRLPYGLLYQVPEVEACAVAAVAEAMAVAHASGIRLTTTDPRQPWVKAAAGLPFEFKASMLQSLEKGSVTEIDFVNGAVVAQGRKLGLPTPVNMALVACMKGIEYLLAPTLAASRAALDGPLPQASTHLKATP